MIDNCLSPERIQRVFQNCVLDIPASGVFHLHETSQKKEFESFMDEKNTRCYSLKGTGNDEVFEDHKLLCKALGFELKKAYMRQENFVRNIKKHAYPYIIAPIQNTLPLYLSRVRGRLVFLKVEKTGTLWIMLQDVPKTRDENIVFQRSVFGTVIYQVLARI